MLSEPLLGSPHWTLRTSREVAREDFVGGLAVAFDMVPFSTHPRSTKTHCDLGSFGPTSGKGQVLSLPARATQLPLLGGGGQVSLSLNPWAPRRPPPSPLAFRGPLPPSQGPWRGEPTKKTTKPHRSLLIPCNCSTFCRCIPPKLRPSDSGFLKHDRHTPAHKFKIQE